MNKKIPMILGLVMASSFAFASCDSLPFGKKDCEHTFSESWSTDKTHHWHAATCEHGEEKDAYAEHADANEDGVCDVCEYEIGHTHGYSADWSTNDTHHWHAATCTHTDEKSEYALHTDADTNGECDVCKGHVHVVSDAGYCDGCGTQIVPIDENNVATVIGAIVSQNKNIVSGEVNYSLFSVTNSVVDDNGQNGYADMKHNVKYTLGEQDTYIERVTSSEVYAYSDQTKKLEFGSGNDLTKLWFYTEGEEVKGFQEYTKDNEMSPSIVSADEDSLAGYYFAVSSLADGYGAEEILFNLYTLSQEDSASDYTIRQDINKNTCSFSFNSLIINTDTAEGEDDAVRYYETAVKFTYSDSYTLTALTIVCDAYTNDPGWSPEIDYSADIDYDYDQATKTIKMRENADPDTYTFNVTQVAGKRSYVHIKDFTEYLPQSFNFSIDGEAVESGANLQYSEGDDVLIGFVCDPASSFDMVRNELDAILTYTNGTSSSYAFIDIDDYSNTSIYVEKIAAGEYTLIFTYEDETVWSATLTVTAPIITGDYVPVVITDNNTFDGQLVEFTAPASGAYTFTIPKNCGAIDKDEYDSGSFNMRPYVDANENTSGDTFTVDIAQGDTYCFYVSSPSKGTLNIPYSFVAKEVVSGGDQDGGNTDTEKYNTVVVEGNGNVLYFSADEISADAATRSMIITNEGDYKMISSLFMTIQASDGSTVNRNSDYSYTLSAGTYTLNFSMFTMLNTKADEAYTLNVERQVSASELEPDGSETTPFVWDTLPENVTINADTQQLDYYLFTATESGILTFTWPTADSWFAAHLWDMDKYQVLDSENAQVSADGCYLHTSESIQIEAGKTYRIGLDNWATAGETTITITFVAA